ncbi:hypothetical protein [Kineococcus sp. NPDC059986]|uniref:WapI family immunity protein n=1 Tax=Kineococcus sp. NPDC059986 TaxID=3155538 RepID=UPI00344E0A96
MQLTSTDGAVFVLGLTGYQYPGRDDPGGWDANWLVVHGEVRTSDGESWSFDDPSLTTWDAQELQRWLHAAAEGHVDPVDDAQADGTGRLAFTEPNLAFSIAAVVGHETLLRVHLSAEAVSGRPGWTRETAPELYAYTVPFRLHHDALRTAAQEWDRDVEAFPPR